MSRETLYQVRINGRKHGTPAPINEASRTADAHQEMRPDARVTIREVVTA